MLPSIRRLTVADIPAGLVLTEQSRWNTTEADWRRQLDLEPDGCFAAELDGRVIDAACACVFETVAWVNLVLVNQAHRGRGIGTSLMRAVLAWLDDRRVPSVRLDATPLGRPVYEKLGFTTDYELTRHEGTLPIVPGLEAHAPRVQPGRPDDLPAVIRCDEHVTGTHRAKLLRHLFERQPFLIAHENGEITGYASCRSGTRARHIGPCQGEATTCRALMASLSRAYHGDRVFIDVPDANALANAFVRDVGFVPQRKLTRMTRGTRIDERLERYWCGFGPEKGWSAFLSPSSA